jgi:DNA-binding HxlR family transcriptional regulator
MTESEDKNKNFQDVHDEFHKYLKDREEKNSKYRKELKDKYCRKIYDALFSEVKLNNKYELKFNEIYRLTGMTRPTLILHLKHLEEKGFITKKVQTKYKTSYRINLEKTVKVCKITKTITGKEKLKLIDITKLKNGDEFFLME